MCNQRFFDVTAPKVIWISAMGLGPDLAMARLRMCPSLARLIRESSFGFLSIPGIAVAEVLPAIVHDQRPCFDLRWSPELCLPDYAPSMGTVVTQHFPEAIALTYEAGVDGNSRHIALAPEHDLPGLERALRRCHEAATQLVSTHRPQLVYAELPGCSDAVVPGQNRLLAPIDELLGQLIALGDDQTRVLLTSPLSYGRYEAVAGVVVPISRSGLPIESYTASGQGALVVCDAEHSDALREHLMSWSPFNQPVFAHGQVRPFPDAPDKHLVQMQSLHSVALSADTEIRVSPTHALRSFGLACLAGPGIRRGAFMAIEGHEILAGLRQLLSEGPESSEGSDGPWSLYFGKERGVTYLAGLVDRKLQR